MERLNSPLFARALSTTFEVSFQSNEFHFALSLLAQYPELLHTDYVRSQQFTEELFISASDGDMRIVQEMFETFNFPVHVQTRTNFNLFEFAVSIQDLRLADYAHRVLGLSSDKDDMLLVWMAYVGNRLMIRYLHNDVGLQLKDTDSFLESCARSGRSEMVEFAAVEMAITTVDTPGPIVAAAERAADLNDLKPLQDLIDRFSITVDPAILREAVPKEYSDSTIALYIKEMLNLDT